MSRPLVLILLALAVLPCRAGIAAGSSAPTYNRDVAPIVYGRCLGCHRTGGMVSAVPYDSYEAVSANAQAILKAVVARSMPPWSADPAHSLPLRDDPRLTGRELDTLVAWVGAGMARGNPADLPPMPAYVPGWQHPSGKPPDAVVSLPAFAVKATGEIPYIQLHVKVPLTEDHWISGMQMLPGNGALVHHMGIAEVQLAEGMTPQDLEELGTVARQMGLPAASFARTRPAVVDPDDPGAYDMLDAYTPGETYESYGEGNAKLMRGGKDFYINFNIHYTTTGRPETDHSRLGLWFQSAPPLHQVFRVPAPGKTIIANGVELLPEDPGTKAEGSDVAIPPIPPFAANYELIGVTAFRRPVMLFSFQPHAHLRAKDFRYVLYYPDGSEHEVLSVPSYDFHWQLTYELKTPLSVPAGAKLVVTAHYDNSNGNAHLREAAANDPQRNCGPEKQAYFRDQNQSWDEMFSPIVQYAVAPAGGAARAHHAVAPLEIVTTAGCLAQPAAGRWVLQRAAPPLSSQSQSTSRAELAASAVRAGGDRQYPLVGAAPFGPERHAGQRVQVKGVLVADRQATRLNVTSLTDMGASCE